MLKKNSIVKFILLTLIAICGIFLCVMPFSVPATTNRYNGFISSIQKGLELNGGVSAIYNCSSVDESEDGVLGDKIDSSIEKVKKIFDREGYYELKVVRQGERLRIESAGARETDYAFNYIENYKKLSITVEQVSDSVTNPEIYATGADLKTAYAYYTYDSSSNVTYGIQLEFSTNGMKNLENAKDFANKTSDKKIYIYLGDVEKSNLLAEVNASDVKSSMFVTASSSGSYSISSYEDAREIAYSVVASSLGVKLELAETSEIAPTVGENIQTILLVLGIVMIVLTYAILILRYNRFGLIASLSLTFFVVFDLFLIQSIPLITLNIVGIVAMLIGFAIAVISNVVIFEKIREEYTLGKKIHLSCKGGLKKALWPILDSHFILALMSIVLWIVLPSSLKSFAIILLVAELLSVFCSLVLTRYFINLYLPINSTKAKKLNLYRDKAVKEEIETASTTNNEVIVGGENND